MGCVLAGTFPTESALVEGLKRNESEAYHFFYDQYAPLLYGIVCKIVVDRAVASQVMEEAFLDFWRTIHLYDPKDCTLTRWALNISRKWLNSRSSGKKFDL